MSTFRSCEQHSVKFLPSHIPSTLSCTSSKILSVSLDIDTFLWQPVLTEKKEKIGHLWGLQAEGERVPPRVISELQFYNKRRSGEGESVLISLFCFLFLSCCSVAQVVSNSLQPHGLQHTRLPCPSSSPGACSNSCQLSQWRHPTISSSVPFSSCLQSFQASGSFLMSHFFASGGQSIGASVSVLQWIVRVYFL